MSGYLILIHITAWISMCVVVSAWLMSYMITYRDAVNGKHEGKIALQMFWFVELLIVLMKFLFVILLLFMFI